MASTRVAGHPAKWLLQAGMAVRRPTTSLNPTLRRRNMRVFVRCNGRLVPDQARWRFTSSRVASATLRAASAKSSPEPA